MPASSRSVLAATSGPRRSIPPAVTNRVVRPGPIGAVDHARRGGHRPFEPVLVAVRAPRPCRARRASLQSLGAVLSHHELFGARRRPPVDRPRLVTVDVLAQAVEVARAEPPRHREELGAEDALAEQRHVEADGAGCDEGPLRRERRPWSGPGHPEDVLALGRSGPSRQHAAPAAVSDAGRRDCRARPAG